MSKSNIRVNKPMLFAAILLCLCIVSVYFMNGLYARYYTQVSGDDSARVAKFEIGENKEAENSLTESFAIQLTPGTTNAEKVIQIVSGSEVTMSYTITAKSLQHLPLQFSWDDQQAASETGTLTSSIPAGDSAPRTHTLKISWPTNDDKDNYLYSYELDYIIVTIDYVQVD